MVELVASVGVALAKVAAVIVILASCAAIYLVESKR